MSAFPATPRPLWPSPAPLTHAGTGPLMLGPFLSPAGQVLFVFLASTTGGGGSLQKAHGSLFLSGHREERRRGREVTSALGWNVPFGQSRCTDRPLSERGASIDIYFTAKMGDGAKPNPLISVLQASAAVSIFRYFQGCHVMAFRHHVLCVCTVQPGLPQHLRERPPPHRRLHHCKRTSCGGLIFCIPAVDMVTGPNIVRIPEH